MVVKACPKCGRMPKIAECVSRTDIRRRICKCPNYCSVVSTSCTDKNINFISTNLDYTFAFIYCGDGDDNKIYSIWNKQLKEKNNG